MEVAHARAMEVTSSASSKRRKFDSANQYCCLISSPENSLSPVTSDTSDQITSSACLTNQKDSSRSLDLKTEDLGTEVSKSINDVGFSGEKTESCEVSEEYSEVMESSTKKRPLEAEKKMPTAAEIEEFFSAAEKYEQKRFADKYNYDIVKDVPLQGRYQWVRLKN